MESGCTRPGRRQ